MGKTNRVTPVKPKLISEYAKACLEALSEHGLLNHLSLGGAFGLSYYHEYRTTHDVYGWWDETASLPDRLAVIHCLERALEKYGQVKTRSWGDVYCVELTEEKNGRTVFSFQIAQRSALLEPPANAPWPPGAKVDSLADLLSSKMVALVERGAPRDFRDIYTLCQGGISTLEECWKLWIRRQELAGSDPNLERAKLAIQIHLSRIANHRPLDAIMDLIERENAEKVRIWFEKVFLYANLDR